MRGREMVDLWSIGEGGERARREGRKGREVVEAVIRVE